MTDELPRARFVPPPIRRPRTSFEAALQAVREAEKIRMADPDFGLDKSRKPVDVLPSAPPVPTHEQFVEAERRAFLRDVLIVATITGLLLFAAGMAAKLAGWVP